MTRLITQGSKDYRIALVMMFFGSLAAFGAQYCLQPIIPILALAFDLSPLSASLAMSAGTIGMACSMLLIASISRYLPRKKVMVISLSIASLFILMMAITYNYSIIIGLRFIQGILLAGFPSLAVAYINEEFDSSILGTAIGIYIAATPLGGLTGRILTSTLTDIVSWRFSLIVAGILYLVSAIMMAIFLPPSLNKEKYTQKFKFPYREFSALLHNKKVMMIYIIAFCCMGAFVCSYNFISYVLMAPPYNLSQMVIGFIFVLYLVGSASSAIMGKLSDKHGHASILILCLLIQLIGLLITLGLPLYLKILGLAIFTYGFFGAHANACGWAPQSASNDKAQISAMYMLFYYTGASVIGSIGGIFLTHWNWGGIVVFETAILSVAIIIAYLLCTQERTERRSQGHPL